MTSITRINPFIHTRPAGVAILGNWWTESSLRLYGHPRSCRCFMPSGRLISSCAVSSIYIIYVISIYKPLHPWSLSTILIAKAIVDSNQQRQMNRLIWVFAHCTSPRGHAHHSQNTNIVSFQRIIFLIFLPNSML